jgi:hypothetical protein
VIVDRFRHLGCLLFGQRDTGSLAIDLEGPAPRAGCLERNTSLTDRSNFGELLLQGGVATQNVTSQVTHFNNSGISRRVRLG